MTAAYESEPGYDRNGGKITEQSARSILKNAVQWMSANAAKAKLTNAC
jgi:hypothetical protein